MMAGDFLGEFNLLKYTSNFSRTGNASDDIPRNAC